MTDKVKGPETRRLAAPLRRAERREVRVVLREALGGRVRVNLDGSPVPVLPL